MWWNSWIPHDTGTGSASLSTRTEESHRHHYFTESSNSSEGLYHNVCIPSLGPIQSPPGTYLKLGRWTMQPIGLLFECFGWRETCSRFPFLYHISDVKLSQVRTPDVLKIITIVPTKWIAEHCSIAFLQIELVCHSCYLPWSKRRRILMCSNYSRKVMSNEYQRLPNGAN